MKCIALAGQSPPYEMFSNVDSYAAETPRANTKMWTGQAWGTVTGVGAIAMCNRIGAGLAAAGLDDEVRIYNCAAGGSALLAANALPSTNHWSAGLPLSAMFTQVAAGVTIPDVVVWWQGWQDYLFWRSNMRGDCETALSTLFTCWKKTWNKPGLLMNLWPSGSANYGGAAPTMSPYVQAAQLSFATSTTGVYLGFSCYDLDRRDGVHFAGNAQFTAGVRGAICVLAQLGIGVCKDVEMPRVTSVNRSGATFVFNTNAELFAHSLSAGGSCGGVEAWDDAWQPVQIVSAWPQGNQVSITFPYDTGAHIVYMRGSNPDTLRLICTKINGVRFPLTAIADEQLYRS